MIGYDQKGAVKNVFTAPFAYAISFVSRAVPVRAPGLKPEGVLTFKQFLMCLTYQKHHHIVLDPLLTAFVPKGLFFLSGLFPKKPSSAFFSKMSYYNF